MAFNQEEHDSRKTILVVDDDEYVRYVISRTLERKGYVTLEADSADSAIQVWAQHSQPIDLLLTDIRMPGKTGLELATILRQRKPQLRVLLISGFSDDILGCLEEISHSMVFLQKPFFAEALLEAVQKAIGFVIPIDE